MKKIITIIILLLAIGVGVKFYMDSQPVKFNITLANGDTMSITYEEFDQKYTMKNNLSVFYGAEFTFKDKVKSIEDASIEMKTDGVEEGSFIRFESGMTLFVSKTDKTKYDEKMEVIKEGKTIKVTTYFTEKSNRGSFPIPTLMPYMDYENLSYDYSKLIVK